MVGRGAIGIRGVAVCPRRCQGSNHSVAVQQQGGGSRRRESIFFWRDGLKVCKCVCVGLGGGAQDGVTVTDDQHR